MHDDTRFSVGAVASRLNVMLHATIRNDDFQRDTDSVAMLEQCCNHWQQCRNNAVMLCCAKNRCCESSRVTSPYDIKFPDGEFF